MDRCREAHYLQGHWIDDVARSTAVNWGSGTRQAQRTVKDPAKLRSSTYCQSVDLIYQSTPSSCERADWSVTEREGF
jgi:hypothetical protein